MWTAAQIIRWETFEFLTSDSWCADCSVSLVISPPFRLVLKFPEHSIAQKLLLYISGDLMDSFLYALYFGEIKLNAKLIERKLLTAYMRYQNAHIGVWVEFYWNFLFILLKLERKLRVFFSGEPHEMHLKMRKCITSKLVCGGCSVHYGCRRIIEVDEEIHPLL